MISILLKGYDMKLQTVYNELKDAKLLGYRNDAIDRLLEKLKNSIIDQDIKETTPAVKWNAIKNLLKVSKVKRPALSYIDTSHGDQRFTDAYRLFILKGDDMILNLDDGFIHDLTKHHGTFPDLNSIIEKALNNDALIIKRCDELKKLCKVNDEIVLTLDQTGASYHLNASYVLDALNILQFNNDDEITFHVSSDPSVFKPIYIKNRNNSIAIIMLIKKD